MSTDHFTVDEIPADGSSRQMFDRRFESFFFPFSLYVWPNIFWPETDWEVFHRPGCDVPFRTSLSRS